MIPGAEDPGSKFRSLEDDVRRLKQAYKTRGALQRAGIALLVTAVAASLTTLIPMFFKTQQAERLDARLDQAENILARIEEEYRTAMDDGARTSAMLEEAEENLARMGGLEEIEEQLESIKDALLRADGLVAKATESAARIRHLEDESEGIFLKAKDIDEKADRLWKDVQKIAGDFAEMAVLNQLTLDFGTWQAVEPGGARYASFPGFVMAFAQATDSRDRKTGISRRNGGICGYSGTEDEVKARRVHRAVAYVDTRRGDPAGSFIMPVDQGEYWAVSYCSRVTLDQPEMRVYWIEIKVLARRP